MYAWSKKLRCLCAASRFAFIGSPKVCYDKCTAQSGSQGVSSPNNNAEADGMASIISHELAESVTDPLINAWRGPAPACNFVLHTPTNMYKGPWG